MDKRYKVSAMFGGHVMYRVCRTLSDAYESTTNLWMNNILPILHMDGFKIVYSGETHIKDDLMEALVNLKNGEIENVDYNGITIEVFNTEMKPNE